MTSTAPHGEAADPDVGIEMDDGRIRVIHAMPMRPAYRALYEEANQWPQ